MEPVTIRLVVNGVPRFSCIANQGLREQDVAWLVDDIEERVKGFVYNTPGPDDPYWSLVGNK